MSEHLSEVADSNEQINKDEEDAKEVPPQSPDNYNDNTEADEEEDDPLDACPPNFELAKKHQDANRVKNLDMRNIANKDLNDERMYCPCCRMPTSLAAPQFSICSGYKVLEDLGAGFPLYYQLKIFTICVYTIMFCVAGLAGMIMNSGEDNGLEWNDGQDAPFIVDTSIGSHGKREEEYEADNIIAQQVLTILMIGSIILGSMFLRHYQKKVANEIDESNITPSDYGLMVTGIPLNKTQQEVVEFFKGLYPDLDVVYVNYCYDVKDIVREVRRLTDLQQKKAYLLSYKKKMLKRSGMTEDEANTNNIDLHPPPVKYCCCGTKHYEALESIEEKIKIQDEIVEKLKAEMDVNTDKDLFCGTCFLVLNKQKQAENVVNKFEVSLGRRMINFFIYKVFRCKQIKADERYWEGNHIIVERAAEPGDVYWENLSVSTTDRIKKALVTNSIALLCLGIAFGVNLGLSFAKDALDDSDDEGSSSVSTIIRLISILTSFFVVFINVVLGRIIRILSAYEQHETYSKYHVSVAVKLTIATFVNTGIVPLLVNFGKDNWFDRGGLMVDIFYNTLSVAFIGPFFYLLSPTYLARKIKMCSEERKGEECKLTQRQANDLFEGPPLDMAQRYANTMLLFSLTLFYAFPLPVMPLIGLGGSGFQYWVEKWVLLRRHKIPEQMGETMAEVFSRMIPFLCLLYSLSMLIFMAELSDGKIAVALIVFLIVLAYLFIPVTYIIHKCFSKDIYRHDSMEYRKHSLTFITDYDRANPMSSKEANQKYIERMEESGKLDKEQAARQRMAFNQGGRFGGIMSYGQMNRGMQFRAASNFGGFAMQPRGFYGRQAGGFAMRGGFAMGGGFAMRGFARGGMQMGGMRGGFPQNFAYNAAGRMGRMVFGQTTTNRAVFGSNTGGAQPATVFQQPANTVQPVATVQPTNVIQQPQYRAPAYGQGTTAFAQPANYAQPANVAQQYYRPQQQIYRGPAPAQASASTVQYAAPQATVPQPAPQ